MLLQWDVGPRNSFAVIGVNGACITAGSAGCSPVSMLGVQGCVWKEVGKSAWDAQPRSSSQHVLPAAPAFSCSLCSFILFLPLRKAAIPSAALNILLCTALC